jgi:hypothetical protein
MIYFLCMCIGVSRSWGNVLSLEWISILQNKKQFIWFRIIIALGIEFEGQRNVQPPLILPNSRIDLHGQWKVHVLFFLNFDPLIFIFFQFHPFIFALFGTWLGIVFLVFLIRRSCDVERNFWSLVDAQFSKIKTKFNTFKIFQCWRTKIETETSMGIGDGDWGN